MTSLVCIGSPSWAREVFEQLPKDRFVPVRWLTAERSIHAIAKAMRDRSRLRYLFFLNWSDLVSDLVTSEFECINFHCTPLPYGRGGHPIENMLLRGRSSTVITAHRMTSEVDAGPVYCISESISLSGSKAQILNRFVAPVVRMISGIELAYSAGRKIRPVPQVGDPVLFHRLSPEDYVKFWKDRAC